MSNDNKNFDPQDFLELADFIEEGLQPDSKPLSAEQEPDSEPLSPEEEAQARAQLLEQEAQARTQWIEKLNAQTSQWRPDAITNPNTLQPEEQLQPEPQPQYVRPTEAQIDAMLLRQNIVNRQNQYQSLSGVFESISTERDEQDSLTTTNSESSLENLAPTTSNLSGSLYGMASGSKSNWNLTAHDQESIAESQDDEHFKDFDWDGSDQESVTESVADMGIPSASQTSQEDTPDFLKEISDWQQRKTGITTNTAKSAISRMSSAASNNDELRAARIQAGQAAPWLDDEHHIPAAEINKKLEKQRGGEKHLPMRPPKIKFDDTPKIFDESSPPKNVPFEDTDAPLLKGILKGVKSSNSGALKQPKVRPSGAPKQPKKKSPFFSLFSKSKKPVMGIAFEETSQQAPLPSTSQTVLQESSPSLVAPSPSTVTLTPTPQTISAFREMIDVELDTQFTPPTSTTTSDTIQPKQSTSTQQVQGTTSVPLTPEAEAAIARKVKGPATVRTAGMKDGAEVTDYIRGTAFAVLQNPKNPNEPSVLTHAGWGSNEVLEVRWKNLKAVGRTALIDQVNKKGEASFAPFPVHPSKQKTEQQGEQTHEQSSTHSLDSDDSKKGKKRSNSF